MSPYDATRPRCVNFGFVYLKFVCEILMIGYSAVFILQQRNHFYSELQKDFIVTISNHRWPVTEEMLSDKVFRKCGQYQGIPPVGETVTLKCTLVGFSGRYVYIYAPGQVWMTICEVEIAGSELNRCYEYLILSSYLGKFILVVTAVTYLDIPLQKPLDMEI